MKPMMYVVNVDEASDVKNAPIIDVNVPQVVISAKLEAELVDLSPEESMSYMKELGISETGLDKLIVSGYSLLNLITYFTSGEPETRAWTITRGMTAPQAAGVIHTDFTKGFVKADVMNWQDFVSLGGWSGVRGTGKLRLEGKEYEVHDGDVCYFHIA
jgi:ribosome-binding ATPase YchF (GTP1/OBG family)